MKKQKPKRHYKNTSIENIVEEIDGVIYEEKWADVVGYEGLYMVSDFGRIKSLARVVYKRHKSGRIVGMPYKEFIRVLYIAPNGYISLILSKDSVKLNNHVHRLVAKAFLPNTENKPQVNHILGFTYDNRAKKLEWSTRSENQKHAFAVLGRQPSRTFGIPSHRRKKVVRINKITGAKKTYVSLTEAANKNGLFVSAICGRIRKPYTRDVKYMWKYA